MKTVICGGRHVKDPGIVYAAVLDSKFTITEVVCGGARGADELGRQWAEQRGIPVKMFLADWDKFGKSAGAIRNNDMAKYCEQVIAIWNGKSHGTKNMIASARRSGKPVFIFQVNDYI